MVDLEDNSLPEGFQVGDLPCHAEEAAAVICHFCAPGSDALAQPEICSLTAAPVCFTRRVGVKSDFVARLTVSEVAPG
jgi:hypothetical protein